MEPLLERRSYTTEKMGGKDNRNIVILIVVVLVVIALGFVFMMSGPMGWMMGWGMGYWWISVPLFFFALIVLGAYFLIAGYESREGRALEILKERYAKGEITKQEFEEMKEALER